MTATWNRSRVWIMLRRPKRAEPKHAAYRRKTSDEVRSRWRASGYRCEGCDEVVECVEVAHLFGRRHIVSEPLASDPTLLAALCCARSWGLERIGCHEKIDRNEDVELRDRLRGRAVGIAHRQLLGIAVPLTMTDDPLADVRELERILQTKKTPPL